MNVDSIDHLDLDEFDEKKFILKSILANQKQFETSLRILKCEFTEVFVLRSLTINVMFFPFILISL